MPAATPFRLLRHPLLLGLSLLLPAAAFPYRQPPPGAAASTTESPSARSPRDWAVLACNNEISVITHQAPFFRYRTHVVDQHGDRNRIVVESRDGTVARTVLREGKPLSAEDEAAERKRLEDLAASPSEFEKHLRGDASGKKLAIDLIRLMPDAMIYTPVANPADLRSPAGGRLVIFDYRPNPRWTPPSTSSEALTGLEGRVWIDEKTGYVVRVDGNVFRPVNMGWGMLARIYPGGKLSFEQREIGGGRWLYTHFVETARIRALMVKTIEFDTEVTATRFEQLPIPLDYKQAIRLLLESPAN